MKTRALKVAALLTVALGVATTQAFATGTEPVVAVDNAFIPPTVVHTDPGHQAVFDNQGDNTHNVTAEAEGPDGDALFRTGNVPGHSMRAIGGSEFLDTGNYPFTCTLHPGMDGVFEVSDRGTGGQLPRPEISLKVKSKKLEKVVDSRKLKVKVESVGPTDAEGIELRAKKGRKTITKKSNLDLGAGNSETAKLKLKKKAAERLAGLEKAKVKVAGTVDFGFGDKASKKLK